MEKTRIAAVQMNALLGETDANFAVIERYVKLAAAESAHLVLFPETCLQGHWVSADVYAHAEPLPDGPRIRALAALCRDRGVYVSVGMAALHDHVVYNAQVLVGPAGYVGCSCKLHMSGDEFLTYRGGTAIPVFDIGVCRIGQVVCYDNLFPEIARVLALRGAEVLLMPHAGRSGQWKTIAEQKKLAAAMKATFKRHYNIRAVENAAFCVITNQAGRGGTVPLYPEDHSWQPHHAGGIVFLDPSGTVVAESQTDRIEEEMVVADLDPRLLLQARGTPNYTLRNRRPELYGEILRPVTGP